MRNLLIVAGVFVVLLLLALTYITSRYVDQEAIHKAEADMQYMRLSRDSLFSVVAVKDSLQGFLQLKVGALQTEATTLRGQVDNLERERQGKQLDVRRTKRTDELLVKVREIFPALKTTPLPITERYDEKENISLQYLGIPVWFIETSLIAEINAENYKKQRDKLIVIDSLQGETIALKDTVLALEREKAQAYKHGYDDAYAKYEGLNVKYIELLKTPPSVNLGMPAWGTILGSTTVGVLIGTQLKK
ncbi:MAG: hypothetical protein HW389_464 [Bacteroidetes bacterium]|nr:hypothetical protein [Bacteroidota bacterium]